MISLVLALPLLLPQDYSGRFANHPSMEAIHEILAETLEKAPKKLPKWLIKKAPKFEATLTDLEQPFEHHTWPGTLKHDLKATRDKKYWNCSFDLPVDTFIRDPKLAETAVRRSIFVLTSSIVALESSSPLDVAMHAKLGADNPVIDSMAAYWAGSLEQEIDYILRLHMHSETELAQLVTDIVLPEDGGFDFDRSKSMPDDLTFHMLVHMISKKSDRALGDIYKAIINGQSAEGALKKGTKKSLDKLNPAIQKHYSDYLDKVFKEKHRKHYWALLAAVEADDYEAKAAAQERCEDSDLASPHILYFLQLSLLDGGAEMSRNLMQMRLSAHIDSPLAVNLAKAEAEYFAKIEERDNAILMWQAVRNEYGWQPGVAAEAEKRIAELR